MSLGHRLNNGGARPTLHGSPHRRGGGYIKGQPRQQVAGLTDMEARGGVEFF